MVEETGKNKTGTRSPNNLPFLQAQLLERMYLNIGSGRGTSLKELSELTDYPEHSKILMGALRALIEKGFIAGSTEDGISFSVPKDKFSLFHFYKATNAKNG